MSQPATDETLTRETHGMCASFDESINTTWPASEGLKFVAKFGTIICVGLALLSSLFMSMLSTQVLVASAITSEANFIWFSFLICFWTAWNLFRALLDLAPHPKDIKWTPRTVFLAVISGSLNGIGVPVFLLRLFTNQTVMYTVPIIGCLLFVNSMVCFWRSIKVLFRERTANFFILIRLFHIGVSMIAVICQVMYLITLFLFAIQPRDGFEWFLWFITLIFLIVPSWISSSLISVNRPAAPGSPERINQRPLYAFVKHFIELLTMVTTILCLLVFDVGYDFSDPIELFDEPAVIYWVLGNTAAGIIAYYAYYLHIILNIQLVGVMSLILAPIGAMTIFWHFCEDLTVPCLVSSQETSLYWSFFYGYIGVVVLQTLSSSQLFRKKPVEFPPIQSVLKYKSIRGDILLPAFISNIRHNLRLNGAKILRAGKKRLFTVFPLWNESAIEVEGLVASWADLVNSDLTDISHLEFQAGIDAYRQPGNRHNLVVHRLVNAVKKYFPDAKIDLERSQRTEYGERIRVCLIENHSKLGRVQLVIHGKHSLDIPDCPRKVVRGKRQSMILYLNYIKRMCENNYIPLEDCYILTLDGDTSFECKDINPLIDTLQTKEKCVAVCGRIIPRGTGATLTAPLVAFQKIEYALAHWLVKEMEHVFGSVLCSPGCFSLIRLSALNAPYLDTGQTVLQKFACKGKTSEDFLRYDMGEDRMLCTLLLTNGGEICYNPAAVAYTYCPEEFMEFFNQRRRWIASTLANMQDIYVNTEHLSLTRFYLFLQLIILVSGILSISIIILLLGSALAYVTFFNRATGVVVLGLFSIGYCFLLILLDSLTLDNDTRDQYKYWITAVAVFVVTLLNIILILTLINSAFHDWLDPAAVGFYILIGVMLLGGLLHPTEISVLVYVPVFLLFTPAAYLILPLYAFCNIVDTRWGTRSVQTDAAQAIQVAYFQTIKTWLQWACYGIQQCFSFSVRGSEHSYQLVVGPKFTRPEKHDLDRPDTQQNSLPDPEPDPTLNQNESLVVEEDSTSREQFGLESPVNVHPQTFAEENELIPNPQAEPEIAMEESETDETDDETDDETLVVAADETLVVADLDPRTEDSLSETAKGKMNSELKSLRNKSLAYVFLINLGWTVLTGAVEAIIITSKENDELLFSENPLSVVFLFIFGLVLWVEVIAMIYFAAERYFYWLVIHVKWIPLCHNPKQTEPNLGSYQPIPNFE
jgi:cellulose synthase/poly-beta-1,6-N-acetylglucosamine synthase-like glycosyltransferase